MGNILENLFCSKANILCFYFVLGNPDPSIRYIGIGVDYLLEHALVAHVVDGDPGPLLLCPWLMCLNRLMIKLLSMCMMYG